MPHVFISYVREDAAIVHRLAHELEKRGTEVWLDRDRLTPGMRWQAAIREAIRGGAYFVACFSKHSAAREHSYMNEELLIAIEELRKRPTDRAWFLPVLLSPGTMPRHDIGAGATLADIHYVELGDDWTDALAQLLAVIRPDHASPDGTAVRQLIYEEGKREPASRTPPDTSKDLTQKPRWPSPRTLTAGLAGLLVLAGALWAGGLFTESRGASACAVIDLSSSTVGERPRYLATFAELAETLARRRGNLWVVLAADSRRAEGPVLMSPSPIDPRSVSARAARVAHQTAQLRQMMINVASTGGSGSELLEAASRCQSVLRRGDQLELITDGIQSSRAAGSFLDADLSRSGLASLFDKLHRASLIPALGGVRVTAPVLLPLAGGVSLTARRQQQVRRFWRGWAAQSGATYSDQPIRPR